MNYRHAFHAGNHADCLKHALLLSLLSALKRKPTPFAVLDTHAGCGIYDLAASEANRTGEATRGALRLADSTNPALAPFLEAMLPDKPLGPLGLETELVHRDAAYSLIGHGSLRK